MGPILNPVTMQRRSGSISVLSELMKVSIAVNT